MAQHPVGAQTWGLLHGRDTKGVMLKRRAPVFHVELGQRLNDLLHAVLRPKIISETLGSFSI